MVICALLEDGEPLDPDCLVVACEDCNRDVLLSPTSADYVTLHDSEIVCSECAAVLFARLEASKKKGAAP